ncbi:glycosyl hydrolase family 8 [Enterococcus bulliens]
MSIDVYSILFTNIYCSSQPVWTSNDNECFVCFSFLPVSLSEGQGYGMVITALAAKKNLVSEDSFAELFTYYKEYTVSKDSSLMKWKQENTEDGWESTDKHNATDGDLDIAYALILASKEWPDSKNQYRKAAITLLNDIKRDNYNSNTGLLTVGNWATADKKARTIFRTSDVMPVYFEAFFNFTKDDFWQNLNQKSSSVLKELSEQQKTGLLPDFAIIDQGSVRAALPKEVSEPNDANYSYNASRIPMRLANSTNADVQQVLAKMMKYFDQQSSVYGGYKLNGTKLVEDQSKSFSASILYAAKQDQDNYSGLYKKQQWIFKNPIEGKNYYGDSLQTMVVLQLF